MTEIRDLEPADWPAVETIYRQGIKAGNATFESAPPSWEHFDAGKRADLRLVAVVDGRVVGWAAASPVTSRAVYDGVVEHSVYVADDHQGMGIGRQLVEALIARAESVGVWTIQSSVFPENETSLKLHESAGFRVVGRRERIALMSSGPWAGHWRDTILIERRSR
ncbi:MAG: N-acetyltransferase family protein [Actinomycetota bacterium]|nr:N-acetyltransferase family protein [Actinomycetota bacterium]